MIMCQRQTHQVETQQQTMHQRVADLLYQCGVLSLQSVNPSIHIGVQLCALLLQLCT